MTIIEKQTVKYYHASRIQVAEYNRAEVQGWSDTEAQQARFDAMLSMTDFTAAKVLDIGCGYGDFKARLDATTEIQEYIGLDQQPEFIAFAQQWYRDQANTWFYEADVARCQLPEVDIIVASGVLSYRSTDPAYYLTMIRRFYEAAGQAFIFNMLDDETFASGPLLVAHDREQIFQSCRELCPNASLKRGYLPDDFTIKMAKG